jgi:hypothetical protein
MSSARASKFHAACPSPPYDPSLSIAYPSLGIIFSQQSETFSQVNRSEFASRRRRLGSALW